MGTPERVVIRLKAGIGDSVHIEPDLSYLQSHGISQIDLFHNRNALGIYQHYKGVTEHSYAAEKGFLKLVRVGVPYCELGHAQHHIAGLHRVMQYAGELCRAFDVPAMSEKMVRPPVLPVTVSEKEWGASRFRADAGQLKVVVQKDSAWQSKSLPLDYCNRILETLAGYGCRVLVITDTPGEMYQHPAVHSIPKLQIRSLMAMLAAADRVLAMDSAPGWLSLAVGAATTILFGATNPMQYAYDSENLRFLVSRSAPCLFCNQSRCKSLTCYTTTPPDLVCESVITHSGYTLESYNKTPLPVISAETVHIAKKTSTKTIGLLLPVAENSFKTRLVVQLASRLSKEPGLRPVIWITQAVRGDIGAMFGDLETKLAVSNMQGTTFERIYAALESDSPEIVGFIDDPAGCYAADNLSSVIGQFQICVDKQGILGALQVAEIVDHVVVVTDGLRSKLGWANEILEYIPLRVDAVPGADSRDKWGIGKHDQVVGIKGMLDCTAPYRPAIESMRHLPDDYKLLVAGKGQAYHELVSMAQNVPGKVVFVQECDRWDFYATVSWCLLPPLADPDLAYPMESALCGRPLLVSGSRTDDYGFPMLGLTGVPYTAKGIAIGVLAGKDSETLKAASQYATQHIGVAAMLDEYVKLIKGMLECDRIS